MHYNFQMPDLSKYHYSDDIMEYFRTTVTPHRLLVYKLCKMAGVPKNGALHDLSKYGPEEAPAYCMRWSGKIDPDNMTPGFKQNFKNALLHHIKNNPHHLTFWCDDFERYPESIFDKGVLGKYRSFDDDVYAREHARKIPLNYFIEMICDWIASGIIHAKNEGKGWNPHELLDYYTKNDMLVTIHPDTRVAISYIVGLIADKGLDALTNDNLVKAWNCGEILTDRVNNLFR